MRNGVCLPDPPEGGPLEDGALTTPVRCEQDSECFGGAFCDLGACAEPMVARSGEGFGERGSEDAECDGYLCKADRCRSCASSAECMSDLQCYIVPERGQRCVTQGARLGARTKAVTIRRRCPMAHEDTVLEVNQRVEDGGGMDES